jgi:hypothetical protein
MRVQKSITRTPSPNDATPIDPRRAPRARGESRSCMNEMVSCPVCKDAGCQKFPMASKENRFPLSTRYECPRCGQFILPDRYGQFPEFSERQRALLSYTLRRMQRDHAPPPEVSESILPKPEDPLPSPAEQANRLIIWIGDHQPSHEQAIEIPDAELSALIGTTANKEVGSRNRTCPRQRVWSYRCGGQSIRDAPDFAPPRACDGQDERSFGLG